MTGTMNPSFLIHRARFEVALCASAEGAAFEKGLVALLKGRLLPVLEAVLEGFPWPAEPVTIRELVLDLGDMAVAEAAELLPARFEAQLIRALRRARGDNAPAGWPGTVRGDAAQGAEWWIARGRTDSGWGAFQRALKELLVYGRGGRGLSLVLDGWADHLWVVRQTLRFYAHDRQVPRYAALYLRRHHLKEIVTLLSPEHGVFAGGFVEKSAENRILLKDTAPVAGDADGFERLLWEFTLGYFLVEGRGRFERKQYVSHLVSTMASHENIEAAALLRAFQAIFFRTRDAHGLEILTILDELASGSAEAPVRSPGEEREVENACFQAALERVLRGKGSSADLQGVILGMAPGVRGVREILMREGRRAEVRATMVSLFSHDQLERLVAAMGPEEAAVGRFITRSLARQSELQEHTPNVTSREGFAHLLWELSLAFLLVERRSRFNFKRYLQHLISGMAARYNMAYATLLGAFCRVYKTGGGRREQEDQALLDELWLEEEKRGCGDRAGEAGAVLPPSPRAPGDGPWAQGGAGRDLVGRLWRRLAGGRALGGETVPDLLWALKKEAPVLFMRWVRELQGDPARQRVMVAVLDRESLAVLLRHVLGALTMASGAPLEAMVASCFPGGSADAARVATLLLGRPEATGPAGDAGVSGLQLEAWMALLKGGGGEEAAAMVALLRRGALKAKGREAKRLLIRYHRFLRRRLEARGPGWLARFLAQDRPVSEGATRSTWVLQRLLSGPLGEVKPVLNRSLHSWNGALRLAGLASEPLCARVLAVLAPSWGLTVLPILDALLLGIASAGGSPSLRRWRPLIWAWTLQLAATRSGAAMAPKAFLHTLLAWMASHGGAGGVGALLTQVAANIRPETRAVLAPLVEEMHHWLHGRGDAVAPPSGPGRDVSFEVGGARSGELPAPDDLAPARYEPAAHAGRSGSGGVEDECGPVGEICWVDNAGLVLLSPYLPALFSRLGYLAGGRFKSHAEADHAALLLHHLAHNQAETPAHPLVLNRLLCGTDSEGRHLERRTLEVGETVMADELLRAVVAHWTALKNTSPEGLRESFLARDGRLSLTDGAWHLEVMPKAWDVLLDRLPWGIGPIKHPWMKQLLFVHWR